MQSPLTAAIIKTLVYADVFDYPLTLFEVEKRLIQVKSPKSKVQNIIEKLPYIQRKEEYYLLKGRNHIVSLRKQREAWSREKMIRAKKITFLLRFIPTIQLIGISGALAHENAKKDDDIDLFIITSAGRLWMTRFFVTVLTDLLGVRRHPQEPSPNNKLCLNMFMDEQYLTIAVKERDLFSAYEVVQMKPLFDRGETYKKFLQANAWVKKYLPNALHGIQNLDFRFQKKKQLAIINSPLSILESFLKNFQLWYMEKRRTTEVIERGIIRFHPYDAREWILRKYNTKLKNLK